MTTRKRRKSIRKHKLGLSSPKKLDRKKIILFVMVFAIIGGYFVWRTLAATPVTTPSEFIARSYTETLGRLPEQGEWDLWQQYYSKNGCNILTVAKLQQELQKTKEYAAIPYSSEARLITIYRSVLSREPDRSGFNYWNNRLKKGESYQRVAQNIMGSSEFKKLSGTICSKVNYPFLGKPFTAGRTISGDTVQSRLNATPSGGTVTLDPGIKVEVSKPLLIKRGVTLTTKSSAGLSGRKAYANMARLVMTGPGRKASPVIVMPEATLKNIWVDGQMWSKKTRQDGRISIMVFPTNTKSKVEFVRTENTTGAMNIFIFGRITYEYTDYPSPAYRSDGTCYGNVTIANNLVINSANEQNLNTWSDGISTHCPKTIVTRNEVLDASDVAIIAYRTFGKLSQQSQVTNNKILNAGNDVFGGIAADPISLNDHVKPYPACINYKVNKQPNCDFRGLLFKDNIMWSGRDTRFIIGAAVGTKAWSFFKPDAAQGYGSRFENNGSGRSTINTVIPLYASGLHGAQVTNNFSSSGRNITVQKSRSKCRPSSTQIYDLTNAQGIRSNNIGSKASSAVERLVGLKRTDTRDKCI